jgi:hypothetical protein
VLWREGSRLASIARKHRAPVGTTFSFQLSKPAKVTLTFSRQVPGRRVKGRCAAPSRRNRRAKACKRTLVAGTLTLQGHQGLDKIAFQGRLSSHRRLSPGHYTVKFGATDAEGRRSNAQSLAFTIVR